MNRALTKSLSVIRLYGFSKFLKKSYRVLVNNILRTILFDYKANEKKWSTLKNKFNNKRVFIIGNGPSINKTPLYYLKNEYKICFNRFPLIFERINWKPDFFMIDDDLVLDDYLSDLDEIQKTIDYTFFPDIHRNGTIFFNKIKIYSNTFMFYHTYGDFSFDIPYVAPGNTVVYTALQILFYLGFSEIILVGVDMNYAIHKTVRELNNSEEIESLQDDDPNHFDPRYFGKGKKYHQPFSYFVEGMIKAMYQASSIAAKKDIRILNAGYDSKLEAFEKVDFENLFKYDNNKKRNLFNECIRMNTNYNNINELLRIALRINSLSDLTNFNDRLTTVFYSEMDEQIIRSMIQTHIPLGPYNRLYYYIPRI